MPHSYLNTDPSMCWGTPTYSGLKNMIQYHKTFASWWTVGWYTTHSDLGLDCKLAYLFWRKKWILWPQIVVTSFKRHVDIHCLNKFLRYFFLSPPKISHPLLSLHCEEASPINLEYVTLHAYTLAFQQLLPLTNKWRELMECRYFSPGRVMLSMTDIKKENRCPGDWPKQKNWL